MTVTCATGVTDRFGAGQRQVHFGAGRKWLCLMWGSATSHLTEDASAASLLPKPCHINPVQRLITVPFGFDICP